MQTFAVAERFRWGLLLIALICGRTTLAEKITLGLPPLPISAAVYFAADRGLFTAEGLEVEIQEYATGKEALAEMLHGGLAFAVAADTPFVHASLAGEQFQILATIGESSTGMALLGRRDRGIDAFGKVTRKRVGITHGTNAEFFFDTFCTLQGVPRDQVETVDVPIEMLGEQLLQGEVDAVCTWEPYLSVMRRNLGTNAFTFDGAGLFSWTWNLATTAKRVRTHYGEALKLTRAIVNASEKLRHNPEVGEAIVAKRLRLSRETVREMLSQCNLRPRLTQELILQMEQQFRWLSRGQKRTVPNYLRYVDTRILKAVSPESVTVIE